MYFNATLFTSLENCDISKGQIYHTDECTCTVGDVEAWHKEVAAGNPVHQTRPRPHLQREHGYKTMRGVRPSQRGGAIEFGCAAHKVVDCQERMMGCYYDMDGNDLE